MPATHCGMRSRGGSRKSEEKSRDEEKEKVSGLIVEMVCFEANTLCQI